MNHETIIGLEVHAQLLTDSKIFCGCSTEFGAPPNTHTCPVCLGMPGVLPVLNRKVVDYTLKMALATGCAIAPVSRFARKNYFYPDLPKGYQISQYELPIAEHGHVSIEVDEKIKEIGITRIHMEEDAGKLIHDPYRSMSRVDFNRTGVPLIEIVSEPDIRSPQEAGAYLKQLRAVLRYLGVCDGNMEEGSFRCDANVSIRPFGTKTFGTRTELKNMNSFRHVENALAYEIKRQEALIEEGGEVKQETRLWNPVKQITVSMRGKEEAHDYRYFPDPDLVPLVIDEDWIEKTRAGLPELPEARKARFVKDYNLPSSEARFLTDSRVLADYFEACVKAFPQPKTVCNWIMGSLMEALNAENKTIEESPVPSEELAKLLKLIDSGLISGKIAKTVFEEMVSSGKAPYDIVREKGLEQITDNDAIFEAVQKVLAAHNNEVESYKAGKTKLLGFFVGQVMKATQGKANPTMVNEVLRKMLEA
ncbi:MAG: aspartyl/glutamyl-tRNA amidotransferase subunit B [Desulfobacterales bacterium S7086C20]|nr:MAG: aspartyl/glutamyl-tRNA amidotransferase subunit B [Desulfobacterales bacterium S7086C20]